jgi:hypothetical protein
VAEEAEKQLAGTTVTGYHGKSEYRGSQVIFHQYMIRCKEHYLLSVANIVFSAGNVWAGVDAVSSLLGNISSTTLVTASMVCSGELKDVKSNTGYKQEEVSERDISLHRAN